MNDIKETHNSIGRWTPARRILLDIFIENKTHLTAEEAYLKAREVKTGISISTIYRNLNFLLDQKLIKRHYMKSGITKYELDDDERVHHNHLICTGCNNIKDYSLSKESEKKLIIDIAKKLGKKYNFKIRSYQLKFYGKCKGCREKL
ncbi:MAG: Fur family transcriptional regulator [Elusimicrobiota bacterium]